MPKYLLIFILLWSNVHVALNRDKCTYLNAMDLKDHYFEPSEPSKF